MQVLVDELNGGAEAKARGRLGGMFGLGEKAQLLSQRLRNLHTKHAQEEVQHRVSVDNGLSGVARAKSRSNAKLHVPPPPGSPGTHVNQWDKLKQGRNKCFMRLMFHTWLIF